MKSWPILTLALEREADIVAARQRARRIADLLGFDTQDQTRIATSVSEIARNAFAYAQGGRAAFALEGARAPERYIIRITDRGPGLPDPAVLLEARARNPQTLGLGIIGARRLMDAFSIDSAPGVGTKVAMSKTLPSPEQATPDRLAEISRILAQDAAADPMIELRTQNQELLRSLEAQEARRLEAEHLSEELERTNKGVVALYDELDRRAMELQQLNETLEERVAAAVAEREQVEARLRQSQKMEAVGQLTGGIAHDFNNLLMIIGGSLEMLRRRVPASPVVTQLIDAAAQGVARGGKLNQQLLAFARRQDLRQEAVRIDGETLRLLIERAVGEDISIRIETQDDLWCCLTDEHQLHTALLNLAINARDAMPSGGVLTLSLTNRTVSEAEAQPWEGKAGDYVVVSVTDTGEGMDAQIAARVFEPFFTTKPVGSGTGLGLSQVYGFAAQTGGFVSLRSKPNAGTTVMIHLPYADPPKAQPSEPSAEPARITGDAAILVVEDDASVRAVTCALLRELGYTVYEAGSGPEALVTLGAHAVDLVFSDVILPEGMTGLELAQTVHQKTPGLPVLLTSGYTAQRLNLAAEGDWLKLLRKPYSQAQLSEAVGAALA
jgi:signal transduction histidine kinase